jgi:two-component system NtrC family sensor kinase
VEEVDVNRLVENTLPLVRHVVKERSITIRRQLAATRTVRIDPYDLEEVLINLIINASHAVPAGGMVELTTGNWAHRGVVISVRDNGVGIAPEALHRVFDAFFTTDPQRRTGLGLSVSYGLIRRYGGNITVESEPGQGSVFHVWLLWQPVFEAQNERLNISLGG